MPPTHPWHLSPAACQDCVHLSLLGVRQLPGQRNGCVDSVSGHSSFWGGDVAPPKEPCCTLFPPPPVPLSCLPGPLFLPAPCSGPVGQLQAHNSVLLLARRRPDKRCFHVHTREEVLLPPGSQKCPGSTHGTAPCERLQNRPVLAQWPFLPDEGLDPHSQTRPCWVCSPSCV